MNKDLLPCPFCGKHAHVLTANDEMYMPEIRNKYIVKCSNQTQCSIKQKGFTSLDEAIKSWNKRA